MIFLHTSRQNVQHANTYFFPYIELYKQTRLNNAQQKKIGDEYLAAVVVNCILTEIKQCFDKKLINTISPNIKFKFTEAQGIVLYKSLLTLPLPATEFYLQKIRNEWIEILDQQVIKNANIKIS